jgi:hypothetical protein
MNISTRLNFIKQFQLKRLSHHSLLYTASASYQHQQKQQVNNLFIKETIRFLQQNVS